MTDANPSGWTPLDFRVLVKPDPIKEKSDGGVYLPDVSKDADRHSQQFGVVVAIGPLAFQYRDYVDNPSEVASPKIGDRVCWTKFAGAVITAKNGDEYRVMNEGDIMAVCND